MIKIVTAIYDSKAEMYGQPFLMRTRGEAVRGFIDVANDKKTEIGVHPEDFSLWYIADYDESKGKFLEVKPVCLGQAIELQNYDKEREQK